MDINEIIIKYIQLVISWPVVILIIVILYNKEVFRIINKLLERIKSAEVGGQKFEFFASLENESSIVNTLEKISQEHPEIFKKTLEETGTDEKAIIDYRKNVRGRVSEVQSHLTKLGYHIGDIDGIVGPKTKEAVQRFQKDYGLKVDGIIGPETLKKLYAEMQQPDSGPK